jgi:hypothetical protein
LTYGRILSRTGDAERAAALLDKAIHHSGEMSAEDSWLSIFERARCSISLNQKREAEKFAQRALDDAQTDVHKTLSLQLLAEAQGLK